MYGDSALTSEEKISRRVGIFRAALRRFDEELTPELEAIGFTGFRETPLNNATLLARIRYYHRLSDFDALLERYDGDLVATLAYLKERAPGAEDPFDLLPSAPTGK